MLDLVPDGLKGTLITGAPRSGTTLALKVLCGATQARNQDGIHPGETMYGTAQCEPAIIWGWMTQKQPDMMNADLPALIAKSRHGVIKSPVLAPLLPELVPDYRVITTFRDVRLIVASMMHHPASLRLGMSPQPFWCGYSPRRAELPAMSRACRAMLCAETFMTLAVEYKGPLEVWNYGFWDEWECHTTTLRHHYWQKTESPERIRDDVNKNGAIFSNASFTIDVWDDCCAEFQISDEDQQVAVDTNARLVKLYKEHGFDPKTLDDLKGKTCDVT